MDVVTTHPSPYLPGTNIQYAWDSTSLGYLKTCPRLYQYNMLEGWAPHEESVHLRFGIEYHQALQEYDIERALGIKHDEAERNVVRALLERTADWDVDTDTKAGKYKNRTSIVRTVVWYLEHFKDDPAKTLILDNGKPAVELSFSFELDWGPAAGGETWKFKTEDAMSSEPVPNRPYMLSGHLDRIVSFQDQLFVMDRKTTTTTPTSYYFDQFEPNNQMSLYTLASQVILDSPIKGVIIDAAQILVDTARFVRGFTYRTSDQLDEWLKDVEYWLNLAESYAEAGYWPQNDTACDKFGGCKFRQICSKSSQVREQFLNANFTKLEETDRWNPLKPR